MSSQAKAKVDLLNGLVELEGSEQFVAAHLTIVEKLIASRIQQPLKERTINGSSSITTVPAEEESENSGIEPEANSSRRKRSNVNRRPPGTGYPARILRLRDDGFFSSGREINGVCEELKRRGMPGKMQTVGAALHNLVKANRLEREKINGKWMYLWPSDRAE